MTEQQEKQNKLAKDVLILSRNTLLVNLRFLDMALSRFELLPIETDTLLTDGIHSCTTPNTSCSVIKSLRRSPFGIICTW